MATQPKGERRGKQVKANYNRVSSSEKTPEFITNSYKRICQIAEISVGEHLSSVDAPIVIGLDMVDRVIGFARVSPSHKGIPSSSDEADGFKTTIYYQSLDTGEIKGELPIDEYAVGDKWNLSTQQILEVLHQAASNRALNPHLLTDNNRRLK